MAKIRESLGEARYASGHFDEAARMFDEMMTGTGFPEFLTLAAYERID